MKPGPGTSLTIAVPLQSSDLRPVRSDASRSLYFFVVAMTGNHYEWLDFFLGPRRDSHPSNRAECDSGALECD